jgi:hypothetical protein
MWGCSSTPRGVERRLRHSDAEADGGQRGVMSGMREDRVRHTMWLQRQHPSTAEVSAWRTKEEQLLLLYSAPPSRVVSICRYVGLL